MAPDLNSLPPSRSSSLSNNRPSVARAPSNPLSQASSFATQSPSSTAQTTSGAGSPAFQTLHHSPQLSPRSRPPARMERRRSSNLINDSLTSSSAASPTLDHNLPNPQQHHRAPSLGELHQELESEHEAQVNRLLAQIRLEQDTITALERHNAAPHQGTTSSTNTIATGVPSTNAGSSTALRPRPSLGGLGDTSAPLPPRSRTPSTGSSRSRPQSQSIVSRASLANLNLSGASAQHPSAPREPGRGDASASLSRRNSIQSRRSERSSSRTSRRGESTSTSAAGGAVVSPPWNEGGAAAEGWATGMGLVTGRDEASFVAAETAMVTRENQMLKARIRELERILAEKEESEDGSAIG